MRPRVTTTDSASSAPAPAPGPAAARAPGTEPGHPAVATTHSPAPGAALAGAVLLGLLGNMLFFGGHARVSLLLWVAALAGLAWWVHRLGSETGPSPQWLLVAVGFASCIAIRDTESLMVLDTMAVVLALGIAGMPAHVRRPLMALPSAYALALVRTGLTVAGGLAVLAGRPGVVHAVARRTPRDAKPIALGLVLGTVVIAVFGGLFAAADPVFGTGVESILHINVESTLAHLFTIGFFAWIAAGILAAWLWRPGRLAIPELPSFAAEHALAVLMAVGAMVLTFTLFVAVQMRYLFGGMAFVQSQPGLSVAEYARHGFFEMAAAGVLALPVLYGAEAALAGAASAARTNLRRLSGVQLALMGLVIVSALDRMRIYVQTYGLTQDRVNVLAIILWLAVVAALFATTAMRGQRERFTFGAVAAGFAVLAGLNAVNPDRLIARVNTARAAQGHVFDADYLTRLSADAAPFLLDRLEALPADAQCPLLTSIDKRFGAKAADWRDWNLARARASAAVREVLDRRSDCAAPETPAG